MNILPPFSGSPVNASNSTIALLNCALDNGKTVLPVQEKTLDRFEEVCFYRQPLLTVFPLDRIIKYHAWLLHREPEWISRNSDGLRAGRPRFNSRQRQDNFLFSIASIWALEPTQTPSQCVPRVSFRGSIGFEAPDSSLTSIVFRCQE
jgi:hypothetical protein